jgi:hypothetical protein
MTQAPRHPEVNQENPTAFEPKNQILSATVDRRDALTLELGRDLERVERADEPGVCDLDTLEGPTDEMRLELPADSLDLG